MDEDYELAEKKKKRSKREIVKARVANHRDKASQKEETRERLAMNNAGTRKIGERGRTRRMVRQ